ncbi:MAG: hypothetical protein ABJM29_18320 [Rhizobiaceae bacterium]
MPDSISAEDEVIRIAALKAAKDAADHMVKSTANKNTNSVGAFALYTWGSLAFVSAVFATVIGISPNSLVSQPVTLAENKPVMNTAPAAVRSTAQIVEKIAPSAIQETESPTPPEVAANLAKERSVKLEIPALPEIPVPAAELVETSQKFDIDTLRTGAVGLDDETALQPFPEAQLPEILFAVDIGGAKSASPLINRYTALRRRAPDLFDHLEPRIQVHGHGASLEARLIAGPFSSQADVAQFCRAVRLRLTLDCSLATFEGEAIQ